MSNNLNGAPPEGHDRQCHSTSRVTKKRCRKWALTGRDFCQFHGGRRALASRAGLPKHYTRHLGETLKGRIESLANEAHQEQVQLYEELAVARVIAERAVKLAEPVLTNGDMDVKMHALALGVLGEALSNVKDLVLAAAKIENDSREKVSVRVLDLFVLQLLRAIYRSCDEDVATRIEAEVRDSVSLPSGDQPLEIPEVEGTTLTPDDAVRAMDDTIGV